LAQHGLIASQETPVDLSYLADAVITLRYFEAAGEVKQALAIVKKRSGRHERTIRELKLESRHGIRVGKPLKEFQGVLTGVPVFVGEGTQIMSETNGSE
jgi:circadian clock protein KaiC